MCSFLTLPICITDMKDINNWINKNYERLHSNACRITSHPDKAYDILHQCLTEFLSYPNEKQTKIFNQGKLENYITMCVNIQYKSKSSPYHRIHRKQGLLEDEYMEWKHQDIENEERTLYDIQCDCIFDEIPNLHFYYRELLTHKFIKGMTYQELYTYYNISKNSLIKDIKTGIEMLKQKCEV